MSDLHRIAVLGAGVLGGQIAWHSAFKGKDVVVYDISADAVVRLKAQHEVYAAIYAGELGASEEDLAATWSRLTYSTELTSAAVDVDLVVEAVPEIPDVKTDVYKRLADLLPEHTLVVTNSSTFLPRDFADATGRPDKFCALHFANLIWLMNVVEVMGHAGTSVETLTAVTEFAIEIGMVPIPVRKEQNGYILNSWLVPLLNAAQTLVTNEVATPEDVDRTFMLNGARFGPMGMLDVIGMKTAVDVLAYWGDQANDAQMLSNAAYIKERFLDQGHLGLATGSGYYSYPNPSYEREDFLSVPELEAVPSIVSLLSADRTT